MKFKIQVIGHPDYTKEEVEADEWQIEEGCHIFYVDGQEVLAYPVNMSIVEVITDDIFS